ncbi:MAG TPA: hypothetical protein VFL65_00680 [Jatrophihabitans sp.]|nr:hypothetical protein [Jatrophihabitans sp.]
MSRHRKKPDVLATWHALKRSGRTTRTQRVVACAVIRDGRAPATDKHLAAFAKRVGVTAAKTGAALDQLAALLGVAK